LNTKKSLLSPYQHNQEYDGILKNKFPINGGYDGIADTEVQMGDNLRNVQRREEKQDPFSTNHFSEKFPETILPAYFLGMNNLCRLTPWCWCQASKERIPYSNLYLILTTFCSTAILILTIIYSTTSLHLKHRNLFTNSACESIFILRILSEANTVLLDRNCGRNV
jgi:hypothetical protein